VSTLLDEQLSQLGKGCSFTVKRLAGIHLVQQGGPFKAVADVLGHARLETTAIYAKLDLPTLAPIALP